MESRPPATSELVRRAQRGDVRAYEEIVEAHQDIAFRTAYVVTGSAEDAEDAAQDAFVKAYAALGRFDAHRPLRPWLLRIVANEARNRARASRRRTALAVRAAADSSGGAAPSVEGSALAGEGRRELLAAVGALREEERQVIACRYFVGLSEEETAVALGLRRGTVKSRHFRALARLRAHLGELS